MGSFPFFLFRIIGYAHGIYIIKKEGESQSLTYYTGFPQHINKRHRFPSILLFSLSGYNGKYNGR